MLIFQWWINSQGLSIDCGDTMASRITTSSSCYPNFITNIPIGYIILQMKFGISSIRILGQKWPSINQFFTDNINIWSTKDLKWSHIDHKAYVISTISYYKYWIGNMGHIVWNKSYQIKSSPGIADKEPRSKVGMISKSSLVTIYWMPIFSWFFDVNFSPFTIQKPWTEITFLGQVYFDDPLVSVIPYHIKSRLKITDVRIYTNEQYDYSTITVLMKDINA